MYGNWLSNIIWSSPRSIAELTAARGARSDITTNKGFYAFVKGKHQPSPDRCLYLGIAIGRLGLKGRLGSYLRTSVTSAKAATIRHRGKRLIQFARIKGLQGTGASTTNLLRHDKLIHVCWAEAPLILEPVSAGTRAEAYRLERALVRYFRPLYNTEDWESESDLDLEDEAFE